MALTEQKTTRVAHVFQLTALIVDAAQSFVLLNSIAEAAHGCFKAVFKSVEQTEIKPRYEPFLYKQLSKDDLITRCRIIRTSVGPFFLFFFFLALIQREYLNIYIF